MTSQVVLPNSRALPASEVNRLKRVALELETFTTSQLRTRARVSLSFARKFADTHCLAIGLTPGSRLDRRWTVYTLRMEKAS